MTADMLGTGKDADALRKLAGIYNINFATAGDYKGKKIRGPVGHGLCLENRTVIVDEFFSDDIVKPHEIWHEMCHIITHPTDFGIDDVLEEALLMQFERAVGRVVFSKAVMNELVDWQEMTTVITGDELGMIDNYTKKKIWRDGFDMCRRVGLLNRWNRPTWKLPVWTAGSLALLDERMNQ